MKHSPLLRAFLRVCGLGLGLCLCLGLGGLGGLSLRCLGEAAGGDGPAPLLSYALREGEDGYAVSVSDAGRGAAALVIPEKYEGKPVKAVAEGGFRDCAALVSAILPEGIETVGEFAFAGCSALAEISLPKSLKTLGASAFSGCAALKTISCGAAEKPAGWSDDCFAGCDAKVEFSPPVRYTVTWSVDGEGVEESCAAGETPSYKGKIDSFTDGLFTYTFVRWDPAPAPVQEDVIYTAIFESTPLRFTVTWDVEGVRTEETYNAGEMPSFKGDTAKKPDDAREYSFSGWTPALQAVTGDVTYKAAYEATPRKYTVTWVVDGKLTKESCAYGETPAFKGGTDKDSDVGQSYRFTGWDKEPGPVKGDVTYTAQFESDARSYTVTWIVDGQPTVERYAFGETPSFKGSTEKPPSEKIAYRFTGWDSALTPVTADVSYTAVYEEAPRSYTVTWMVSGRRVEERYACGETPSYKGSTDRADDGQFHYVFREWNTPPSAVTGDVTYVAMYDKTPLAGGGAGEGKSSLLSSPVFWIMIILVALVSAGGIGFMIMQKLARESPEKFPRLAGFLAHLPGTRADGERKEDGPEARSKQDGPEARSGQGYAAPREGDGRIGDGQGRTQPGRRAPTGTTGRIPAVRPGEESDRTAERRAVGSAECSAERSEVGTAERTAERRQSRRPGRPGQRPAPRPGRKKPSLWENDED